jgi:hypothetical protein
MKRLVAEFVANVVGLRVFVQQSLGSFDVAPLGGAVNHWPQRIVIVVAVFMFHRPVRLRWPKPKFCLACGARLAGHTCPAL